MSPLIKKSDRAIIENFINEWYLEQDVSQILPLVENKQEPIQEIKSEHYL